MHWKAVLSGKYSRASWVFPFYASASLSESSFLSRRPKAKGSPQSDQLESDKCWQQVEGAEVCTDAAEDFHPMVLEAGRSVGPVDGDHCVENLDGFVCLSKSLIVVKVSEYAV